MVSDITTADPAAGTYVVESSSRARFSGWVARRFIPLPAGQPG
ncbi:hypothetical protein [Acetobacter pomorum]|nr:hypothetical protein [Acetobacter pomorum]